MNDPESLLTAYFQLMNSSGAAHVYREAVRSGVLERLIAAPQTASELAQGCGLAARPTGLLMEALAALGLSRRDGAQYRATTLTYMLLSSSYKNLGDEYWSHLPALLKTDRPIVAMDKPEASEAHYHAQVAMLGWMLTPAAERAAELLVPTLPAHPAILDVGAGSAIWSLTLAKRSPHATVTAIDWPSVLAVAAESAESLGMQDRFTALEGNYHEVPFPEAGFDLVLLGNVTHLESPAGNEHLFAKSRAALKPGGRLAIVDAFPGQPQGDLNRTLYALGLALRTEQGHVYSQDELAPLLKGAGFNRQEFTPLNVPPYVLGMLICGT